MRRRYNGRVTRLMRIKGILWTWAEVIAVGIWGPALLSFAITCLILGEIPARKGKTIAKAVDNPVLFYLLAFAFIAAATKLSFTSIGTAWSIYKNSKIERGY